MHISVARAANLASRYPSRTLTHYDGRALGPTSRQNSFSAEDIEATRVIERRALHDAVAERVLAADLPWASQPAHDFDIEDFRVDGPEYEQVCRFYLALTSLHGVGPAIATKLMYLKWPGCTAITDSVVRSHYADAALNVTAMLATDPGLNPAADERGWTRLFTFVVQDDVRANRASGAYNALRNLLASNEVAPELLELGDCRLQDVLVWSYEGARETDEDPPAGSGP